MTSKEILERLKKLKRYRHRVCDDGDGHFDDFSDLDADGEYVLWADIEALIADIEAAA